MTSERWIQLKDIFRGAMECDTADRAAYLDQTCNGDATLRAEIEALLASHDCSDGFIETPAINSLPTSSTRAVADSVAGRRIGQYEILEEIGRGGMGTVYLGRRADEQYEKRVAIKIVRRGLDTEDILARFRNERQILASLEHPNIARLLDGGTTDDGLPFLVMEYVEGIPVTRYCDEQSPSLRKRLLIFRTICAAVQHAHQHLVVHRDLKPSNILITADGAPKLLDFGIAKLLTPAAEIDRTTTQARVLTPDYASPEQVRGEKLATTSDVYSLGVVLYEILTGRRPYHATGQAMHELERMICETEPKKPSESVSGQWSVVSGSEQPVAGANRQWPIGNRQLKGDLDNIVLMALRKEPARRYQSASQFAADIERHLDGLPVIARRDTFKYRATKFVQRHRVSVAAAAIIFLSLIAGIIATVWQARAAAKQAHVAQQEKARAESINTVLERLLNYSNPVSAAAQSQGHPTTMQEALDEAAKRIDSGEFDNQPEVKAELERIVGISYTFQGQYDLANRHLAAYVTTQRALSAEDDPRMLDASSIWASILAFKGQLAESEQTYRRALPLMRLEYSRGRIKPEVLANTLNLFGYLRRNQGDSAEAESLFRETIALNPKIPAESRYLVRLTRSTLASTIADQGRFDEALQTAREAVEEFRQNGQTDLPDFGFALTVLGGFLSDQGDFVAGDDALRNGETLFRKLLRPTHLWLGDNLRNQALSFYRQGRFAEAQPKVSETLKIYRESYGVHYDNYPTALIIQGLILDKTGKSREGETILRDALKLRTVSLPPEHFWIAMANSALGECLLTQRRFAEAEPLLVQSYQALQAKLGAGDPRTLDAKRRVVNLYKTWNKPDLAAQYDSKRS